jgi:hypothetical protein
MLMNVAQKLLAAVLTFVAIAPSACFAVDTNPQDCADAFDAIGQDVTALVLPAHPTPSTDIRLCVRWFVYSDEIDVARSGSHVTVLVVDNGFSWSPNPTIYLGENLGQLPEGNYSIDVGIQDVFHSPPDPPGVLAQGLQISVSPDGGAQPVSAPTLSTMALAALGALLVSLVAWRQRTA